MNKKISPPSGEGSRMRKGIYLLPNIFTLASLFAGFYAVIMASKGMYKFACWAVLVAMILDALDGRVARMTGTQTAFGAQLDSLADLISFGIAPAMILYFWALHSLDQSGWLSCFLYFACAALRLARFNSKAEGDDYKYFRGLATTGGAGFVVCYVWACESLGLSAQTMVYWSFFVAIYTGFLMVSTLPFRNPKSIDLGSRVSFVTLLIVLMFIVVISYDPPHVLFLLLLFYVISAPLQYGWQLIRRFFGRKNRPKKNKVKEK